MFDSLINELRIIEEKEKQKEEIINERLNYLENENEKLVKEVNGLEYLTSKQHKFIEGLCSLI